MTTFVIYALFPFPICLELLFVGIVLLWSKKWQRYGRALVLISGVVLVMISTNILSAAVLGPLESAYEPLIDDAAFDARTRGVRYIVILGAGNVPNPRLPVTSQQYDTQIVRLVEGLILHNKLPQTKIVVSGGSSGSISEADMMAQTLLLLGMNSADILRDSKSGNTAEQALAIEKIVTQEKFVLVTSAAHIPRAVALFRSRGMRPIPAPTQHMVQDSDLRFEDFLPHVDNLRRLHAFVYEILALSKDRLAGNF